MNENFIDVEMNKLKTLLAKLKDQKKNLENIALSGNYDKKTDVAFVTFLNRKQLYDVLESQEFSFFR